MNATGDIAVLLERLARILQNETHSDGLKPTQWEALRFLARANRFSRTPSAMTAYLGMTKGTVSQTLNALERKGLVRKTSGPADRRQVHIDLTASAKRMLDRDPVDAMLGSLSELPPSQYEGLRSGLEALLTRALRRRNGRPFGVCHSCRYFLKNDPAGTPHRCGLLDAALSEDDSERICLEHEPAA